EGPGRADTAGPDRAGRGHRLGRPLPGLRRVRLADRRAARRQRRRPLTPAAVADDFHHSPDPTRRGLVMDRIEKVLYTAKPHTPGGRDGASRPSDGRLDVRLSTPGTSGTGTNPEQLFAAGWSACFMSAIGLAASQRKVALPADRAIDAEVDLGTNDGGFVLRA